MTINESYQSNPLLRKEFCPLSYNQDIRSISSFPRPEAWQQIRNGQPLSAVINYAISQELLANAPEDIKEKFTGWIESLHNVA
jgi:hypothetical protein